MNSGLIIFLTYIILNGIHAQPSGTHQQSEIILANSGGARTNGQYGHWARTPSESFSRDSHKIQIMAQNGRQSPSTTPYTGSSHYSSQYIPNRSYPSVEFPAASFSSNQHHPVQNSYGSEYSNHEYYPVADLCGSEYSNNQYHPAQNPLHVGNPSYTYVNKPNFKGHSFDSGLKIWTSPNGVKASRSTGFNYKLNL